MLKDLLSRLREARASELDRSNPRAPVPLSIIRVTDDERQLLINLMEKHNESETHTPQGINPTAG